MKLPTPVPAMATSDPELVGAHQSSGVAGLVRLAWSRAWVVVLATSIGAAGALHVSSGHNKVYTASGQVRLETSKGISDDLLGTSGPLPSTHATAELAVLRGPEVAATVASAMHVRLPPAAAFTPQTDPNLIVVSSDAADPQTAAAIVNAYGTAYVAQKRAADAQLVAGATKYLQGMVGAIQAQIVPLQNKLLTAVPIPTSGLLTPAQATEKASNDLATNQLTTLLAQQQGYQNRLNQLQFDAALGKQSDAALLTPALPPTSPSSPHPGRDATLGGVLGLLLGIGLAVLFESLDDRVKTEADVASISAHLPVLATLSGGGCRRRRDGTPRRRLRRDRPLVTLAAPDSTAAEDYRGLRTSIRFLSHDRPINVLQVTRAAPGGDHTLVLANLAVSWSRAGQTATMLCCDLRRPELHTLFGASNQAGLTSVILGDAALPEVTQSVAGVVGLRLVPAGPAAPNPSELLSSVDTDRIFADLIAGSDLLLVDSPPVVPVTDAAVLSQRVDATVLVITLRSTTKRDLADALEALRRVGAPLVGTIVLDGRRRRPRRSRYSSRVDTRLRRRTPPDRVRVGYGTADPPPLDIRSFPAEGEPVPTSGTSALK